MSLNHGALQAANSVTNALLALNSAANFAIYCLVGNKFRRILRRRVLRCGRSTTTTDELTAPPAARESVAPATASVAAPNPRLDGGSLPGADTTLTAVRCARKDDDADRRNEQRVVVVDVSAVDAAATACSSPTTP